MTQGDCTPPLSRPSPPPVGRIGEGQPAKAITAPLPRGIGRGAVGQAGSLHITAVMPGPAAAGRYF